MLGNSEHAPHFDDFINDIILTRNFYMCKAQVGCAVIICSYFTPAVSGLYYYCQNNDISPL